MAHSHNHLDSSDDFFADTPPNLQPRRLLNNGSSSAIVEVNSVFTPNWSLLTIKILIKFKETDFIYCLAISLGH